MGKVHWQYATEDRCDDFKLLEGSITNDSNSNKLTAFYLFCFNPFNRFLYIYIFYSSKKKSYKSSRLIAHAGSSCSFSGLLVQTVLDTREPRRVGWKLPFIFWVSTLRRLSCLSKKSVHYMIVLFKYYSIYALFITYLLASVVRHFCGPKLNALVVVFIFLVRCHFWGQDLLTFCMRAIHVKEFFLMALIGFSSSVQKLKGQIKGIIRQKEVFCVLHSTLTYVCFTTIV